jgi:SET domain-containing protein
LPKGAFVCEYVGEILTNTEWHERSVESTQNDRYVHPILLDAGWCSERVLKDEEALCLDGTFYGNVGRFINHRCTLALPVIVLIFHNDSVKDEAYVLSSPQKNLVVTTLRYVDVVMQI